MANNKFSGGGLILPSALTAWLGYIYFSDCLTDVTPSLQNPAACCVSRHFDENRNPVLSGVPDTGFRRYDDSA